MRSKLKIQNILKCDFAIKFDYTDMKFSESFAPQI